MRKIRYAPDSTGYTFDDAEETVAVTLKGGAPRVRRDIIGGAITLSATWILGYDQYDYFRAFYKLAMEKDAGWFKCDLILDDPDPIEVSCVFMPGTMKLAEHRGHMYKVTATLSCVPPIMDFEYEETIMDLVEAYGSEQAAEEILNLLAELANIRLGAI